LDLCFTERIEEWNLLRYDASEIICLSSEIRCTGVSDVPIDSPFPLYEDVRGRKVVSPLILNVDVGWIRAVSFTRPGCFTPGRETRYPFK